MLVLLFVALVKITQIKYTIVGNIIAYAALVIPAYYGAFSAGITHRACVNRVELQQANNAR